MSVSKISAKLGEEDGGENKLKRKTRKMLVFVFPLSIISVAFIATGSAGWDQLEFKYTQGYKRVHTVRSCSTDAKNSWDLHEEQELLQQNSVSEMREFYSKIQWVQWGVCALSAAAVCVWRTATLENSLGTLSKVGLRKKRIKHQKHLSLLQGVAWDGRTSWVWTHSSTFLTI